MNNIDILEEKEKIKDKLFPLAHINGYINLYEQKEARIYTSKLSEWQSATKDSLNLIETLIAENKELKEKNNELDKKDKVINYMGDWLDNELGKGAKEDFIKRAGVN